jgi:hypothetical protein
LLDAAFADAGGKPAHPVNQTIPGKFFHHGSFGRMPLSLPRVAIHRPASVEFQLDNGTCHFVHPAGLQVQRALSWRLCRSGVRQQLAASCRTNHGKTAVFNVRSMSYCCRTE